MNKTAVLYILTGISLYDVIAALAWENTVLSGHASIILGVKVLVIIVGGIGIWKRQVPVQKHFLTAALVLYCAAILIRRLPGLV